MKPKFFITTTISRSLGFFSGQLTLLSKYFDICAISSEKDGLDEFGKEEGVRTYYIKMSRPISLLIDFFSLLKFIYLFIKERPYIVHGNTPKASFLSMLAAKLTCRPVRIYMCHGLRYQGTQGFLRKLLMFMEKITCKCATHVLCVSKGVFTTFENDGICKSKKMKIINYGGVRGIDTKFFSRDNVKTDIRSQLGIPDKDFVFTFIGRIVKDKGINELISAFHKLSKENEFVHLVIVGAEEEGLNSISDQTRSLINSNERIYAVGRHNDVRPFLLSSNAFILPSYREGFGIVLTEAGAMGVPSITTNIIGCNEIIEDGINGSLIPPRDEIALFNKMSEWVNSPQMIAEFAKVSRERIVKRYEQLTLWKAYIDFYLSLIK